MTMNLMSTVSMYLGLTSERVDDRSFVSPVAEETQCDVSRNCILVARQKIEVNAVHLKSSIAAKRSSVNAIVTTFLALCRKTLLHLLMQGQLKGNSDGLTAKDCAEDFIVNIVLKLWHKG